MEVETTQFALDTPSSLKPCIYFLVFKYDKEMKRVRSSLKLALHVYIECTSVT